MRENKIFKKQSALVGYYSAQPGSRLMTPHRKKKKSTIKNRSEWQCGN